MLNIHVGSDRSGLTAVEHLHLHAYRICIGKVSGEGERKLESVFREGKRSVGQDDVPDLVEACE